MQSARTKDIEKQHPLEDDWIHSCRPAYSLERRHLDSELHAVSAAVYRILDFNLRRYSGDSTSFINGATDTLTVTFLPCSIVGTSRLKQLIIRVDPEHLQNVHN